MKIEEYPDDRSLPWHRRHLAALISALAGRVDGLEMITSQERQKGGGGGHYLSAALCFSLILWAVSGAGWQSLAKLSGFALW